MLDLFVGIIGLANLPFDVVLCHDFDVFGVSICCKKKKTKLYHIGGVPNLIYPH